MKTHFYILTALLLVTIVKSQGQSPVLLKDINPTSSSTPLYCTELNGKVYFTADDGVHGRELWITDGTSSGTAMFMDINPTGDGIDYNSIYKFNNQLFFWANDGVHGYELWVSDGSVSGTQMILDVNPGIVTQDISNEICYANNKIYFVADNGITGEELWVTDGLASHTSLVKDIEPNGSGIFEPYFNGVEYNGYFYFGATTVADGPAVWRTDGTIGNTTMFHDIPGTDAEDITEFIVSNNYLFYTRENSSHLWRTDGTVNGTIDITPIDPFFYTQHVTPFISYNNEMYFGFTNYDYGMELWKSDGSIAGTEILKDITPGRIGGGSGMWFFRFIEYHGKLYFVGDDGITGIEIWSTDGTESGTALFKDCNPTGDGEFFNPYIFQDKIYFISTDGVTGYELWSSDGTEANTQLYADLNPSNTDDESPSVIFGYNNDLYFSANDGESGYELWTIAGTTTGTHNATEVNQVALYPNPTEDIVNVAFENGNAIEHGELINSKGVIVDSWNFNGEQKALLNLNDKTPGLYFIVLYDKNGNRYSERISKR